LSDVCKKNEYPSNYAFVSDDDGASERASERVVTSIQRVGER